MSGGRIELVGLSKRFDELAVDNIDLVIERGEFFSLLGPSGCGKTTTLRLVAGFEAPTSGRILLEGVDLAQMPPHKRPVNTVFQHYALFPFMSVADNVAFGLRYQKLAKHETRTRVGEALELVQMTRWAKRRPGQLSGGQQQRVALARALVLKPAVLLLDEPLGALDAKLRRALKVELKALQEHMGITFLYVTHDQEEALTMSDRLAVMRDGRLAQIGRPQEVYDEPADTYVADFLGACNLMEVEVIERRGDGSATVAMGEFRLQVHRGGTTAAGPARCAIRPEKVVIEPFDATGPNRVSAMVERLVYLGAATQVVLRLAPGVNVLALVHDDPALARLAQGSPVQAVLAPDALRVLPDVASPTPHDEEGLVDLDVVRLATPTTAGS